MAEIFAKESPDRVYELEQWGALFNRTPEGKISQRPFGGHTHRAWRTSATGRASSLYGRCRRRTLATDAKVYMETTVTKLFKKDGRVVGRLAYTRESGKFVHFKAKAVVMATGGWGRIFKVTSNSWEGTGDGVVHSYDAGAELVDMEMMQFHPTGWCGPRRARPARDGGRARRGRASPQLRGQAVHGELRREEDGALDARRGRAGQLHEVQEGRGSSTAGSTSTSRTSATRAS
jgi:succinate dehydrogenase / fumarate reductase flavoprotein subunit